MRDSFAITRCAVLTMAVWSYFAVAVARPNDTELQALNVLRDRCLTCHNSDRKEGGYDLSNSVSAYQAGDSEAKPIESGDAARSELWRRLVTEDESIRMPSEGERLPQNEIDAIRDWINGAQKWNPDREERLVDRISTSKLVPLNQADPILRKYGDRTPSVLFRWDTHRHRLYVAGWGEILVWDGLERSLIARWTGLGRRILGMDISATGEMLAVSSGTPGLAGSVHLIPLSDPSFAELVWNDRDIPLAVAFSPNGKQLAIGCMDGRVVVMEPETKSILLNSAAHADQVLSLAWNKDGSRWISGSRDRTSRVMEFPSLELKVAYSGHERAVSGVGFSKLGPITLDETGSLRLWSADDGDRVLTRRANLPQVLQSVHVVRDRVYWTRQSSLEGVVVSRRDEEDGKDDKGNPKKKVIFEFSKIEEFGKLSSQGSATCMILADRWFLCSPKGELKQRTENDQEWSNEWRIYP